MLDQIEAKIIQIDTLSNLLEILKEEYQKHKLCWKTRNRIAWEHQKAQLKSMKAKKEYLELCDMAVSGEQLENWLLSQHINRSCI